jgi:CBS domain-containing protein
MTPRSDDGRTQKHVMTPDPESVAPDATIRDVAQRMSEDGIGSVLVIEDGQLAGIITDRDLVTKGIARGLDAATEAVGPIASVDVVTATPEMSVRDAANLMADHQVRRLPVLDNAGRVVGIVSMQDVAQASVPAVSGMAEQGITAE